MPEADFAEKLYQIFSAKLGIREAIRQKGVPITNATPFSEYAALIMQISGSGGVENPEGVRSLSSLMDNMDFTYILPQKIAAIELADLIAELTAGETLSVGYPPTNGFTLSETAESLFIEPPVDEIKITFLLFAFAESFLPQNSGKYDYNPTWLSFGDSGAYLNDVGVVNSSNLESATPNGVFFSVPLPNRQSYGYLNQLTVKMEVNDG